MRRMPISQPVAEAILALNRAGYRVQQSDMGGLFHVDRIADDLTIGQLLQIAGDRGIPKS